MAAVLRLAAETEQAHRGRPARDLSAESAWLARSIRGSNKRVVGLLPADRRADVLALATDVGTALALIESALVVIVDPQPKQRRGVAGTGFAAAIPSPGLCLLVGGAEAKADGAAHVKELVELLHSQPDTWSIALVDLSRFRLPGEYLGVESLLDGIIVVGAAGRVTDRELAAVSRWMPAELNLGVVLTD